MAGAKSETTPKRKRGSPTTTFKPGNKAAVGNKAQAGQKKAPKCPEWMRDAGMRTVWSRTYFESIGEGANKTPPAITAARKQITEWIEKQRKLDAIALAAKSAGTDEAQRRAEQFDGLPDEVCDLLELLGTGLGNVLDRHEAGLPLSPTEQLIATYATRFARGRKRTQRSERLREAIGQIVETIRGDLDDVEEESESAGYEESAGTREVERSEPVGA